MSTIDDRMTDAKLISKMRMLVGLNNPEHGGPYGGTAATIFVETMALAADRLEALSQAGDA